MALPHEDAIALVTAATHGDQDMTHEILSEIRAAGAEHATGVATLLAGMVVGAVQGLSSIGGGTVDEILADAAERVNGRLG